MRKGEHHNLKDHHCLCDSLHSKLCQQHHLECINMLPEMLQDIHIYDFANPFTVSRFF